MTIASGSHSATAVVAARFHKSASGQGRLLALSVHAAITRLLAEHGLEHVAVELAAKLPEQSSGGKCRTVIPLRH